MKTIFTILALSFFLAPGSKKYHKQYYENNVLKEEGWKKDGKKTGYWKFYHQNGKKMKEGHYKNDIPTNYWYFYKSNGQIEKEGHYKYGKKNDWWLFYDGQGKVNHKCQLKNGTKNGYCLKYKNNRLKSAEKYANGKKVNEWFDFRSFKRDNNLSDLK